MKLVEASLNLSKLRHCFHLHFHLLVNQVRSNMAIRQKFLLRNIHENKLFVKNLRHLVYTWKADFNGQLLSRLAQTCLCVLAFYQYVLTFLLLRASFLFTCHYSTLLRASAEYSRHNFEHKAGFPLANFFARSEFSLCLYPISSTWFQLRDQRQIKNFTSREKIRKWKTGLKA